MIMSLFRKQLSANCTLAAQGFTLMWLNMTFHHLPHSHTQARLGTPTLAQSLLSRLSQEGCVGSLSFPGQSVEPYPRATTAQAVHAVSHRVGSPWLSIAFLRLDGSCLPRYPAVSLPLNPTSAPHSSLYVSPPVWPSLSMTLLAAPSIIPWASLHPRISMQGQKGQRSSNSHSHLSPH